MLHASVDRATLCSCPQFWSHLSACAHNPYRQSSKRISHMIPWTPIRMHIQQVNASPDADECHVCGCRISKTRTAGCIHIHVHGFWVRSTRAFRDGTVVKKLFRTMQFRLLLFLHWDLVRIAWQWKKKKKKARLASRSDRFGRVATNLLRERRVYRDRLPEVRRHVSYLRYIVPIQRAQPHRLYMHCENEVEKK